MFCFLIKMNEKKKIEDVTFLKCCLRFHLVFFSSKSFPTSVIFAETSYLHVYFSAEYGFALNDLPENSKVASI